MSNISSRVTYPSADPRLDSVRKFAGEHGSAMCSASLLLGGQSAERKCLRLLARLRGAQKLGRSDVLDLINVHRLLRLEHVGDPDREETGRFSEIDPNDPRVHDLCLLADRLLDLLKTLAHGSDRTAAAAKSGLDDIAA